MPAQRTTWLVTPEVTVAGTDYLGDTPPEALASMGALLVRVGGVLHRQRQTEGLVLVDERAAAMLGLSERATDDGTRQRALDAATAAGYRSGKLGTFTQFFGHGRPTIHVGRAEVITAAALASDPRTWPWCPVWHPEVTTGPQHWHRLTGIPWQSGPAIIGVELIRRTLKPYRVEDVKGQRSPDLKDTDHPDLHDAGEAVWTPEMWHAPQIGAFLHTYDKRRAGITAARVAKLSPARLTRRRFAKFDPKRAGWWEVTNQAWNDPRMPHPLGPQATNKHAKTVKVTTATLELAAELAAEGVFSMPEVVDSWTGPARQVLGPFAELLETTYQAPADDDYPAWVQEQVREAVKVVGERGIGMLNKGDGNSTILRRDWFYGVNATKRANGWRRAWRIGNQEKRWPVAFQDDSVTYVSDDPDPLRSAPRALHNPTDTSERAPRLNIDAAGQYRIEGTRDNK